MAAVTFRGGILWLGSVALSGCFSVPQLEADVGYAPLRLSGNFGYQENPTDGPRDGAPVSIRQDVESAFGLGDRQGSPYGRLALDLGSPVLSVSGFQFQDSGDGVLQADFGSGLAAGTPVYSELELVNVKAALAFDIALGPVALSPGLAVDYLGLDLAVEDVLGVRREQLDFQAPLPLPFLRGAVDLGLAKFTAELGYLELDISDVRAKVLDAEALLHVRPWRLLDLFVGYRYLQFAGRGEIDGKRADFDLNLGGFLVGGGIVF
ncbi:MAG: hypothetical protein JNK49_02220 [Planctomycetes bacterium]|nr:hypothetical protein [Planctomycetota bacterium]